MVKEKKGLEIKQNYNKTKGENVMKKMNNKGFSLVELIVVVLIMAIIAVALAPQVMKWVENSRKSTDIENYNALVEAANVASTNEDVIAEIKSATATISMDASGTSGGGTNLQACMAQTLPGYTATKITSGDWSGYTFKIVISSTGNGIQVQKGDGTANSFPVKDFS